MVSCFVSRISVGSVLLFLVSVMGSFGQGPAKVVPDGMADGSKTPDLIPPRCCFSSCAL